MKFSEFLLKEEINNGESDFIKKYSDIILNLIKKDNNDILVVNSLYIKNNKDVSDILKDDLKESSSTKEEKKIEAIEKKPKEEKVSFKKEDKFKVKLDEKKEDNA